MQYLSMHFSSLSAPVPPIAPHVMRVGLGFSAQFHLAVVGSKHLQRISKKQPHCLYGSQDLLTDAFPPVGACLSGFAVQRRHGHHWSFMRAGFYARLGVSSGGDLTSRDREGFSGGSTDVAMDAQEVSRESGDNVLQAEGAELVGDSKDGVTVQVSKDLRKVEPQGVDSDIKEGVKIEQSSSSASSRKPEVHGSEPKGLWAEIGQRINIAGVTFASNIIVWEQHLAVPHVSVPDIRWIDWKALRKQGFEGVVFDKDNTITAPYAGVVWPALTTALQECKSVFDGHIALLSNSAGLYQFDPDGSEAKALEDKLGFPVIRHGTKKPAGTADDVGKHFNCNPSLLVMVGDRYFTDIVYGNKNGLLTIHSAPLTAVGEPFVVRQVRKLEDALVERWQRLGVQPTKHTLFSKPHDFIKDPGCW